jgi:hypothetical protein
MQKTAMKPVRYRLYTDAELGKLSERAQQALADWGKDWLSDALCSIDAPAAHAGNSADSAAIRWLTADVDDRTALAIGSPLSWTQKVGALLAGAAELGAEGAPASPVSQHLADTLLHSLAAALLQAAGAAFDPARVFWGERTLSLREESSRPGSGWVAVSCRFDSADQSLLLFSPALVSGFIGAEPGLRKSAPAAAVPVRRAVELQPVVLEVIAGGAELTLRDLQTLEVGDVIRLDRRLDELLRLGVLGGEAVCSGHLGAAKGHKAVQLLFTE